MNMNARTGLGIIALVLALAACFATGAAIWLSLAALVAATVAAAFRGYFWALAVVAVVVVNTFFLDPTLWTLTAGEARPGRDRSVDAIRIFLLLLIASPIVAIAVNQSLSKLTERIIAVVAIALLITFLAVIAFKVPQLPLILVFTLAVVMAIYDFTRELREKADPAEEATEAPDD